MLYSTVVGVDRCVGEPLGVKRLPTSTGSGIMRRTTADLSYHQPSIEPASETLQPIDHKIPIHLIPPPFL